MKTCLVVMGGAADRAQPALRGGTPLERARLPHVDGILKAGRLGSLRTIPEGADPGFETALPLLLGCDPGQAPAAGPLEALGMGRELRPDETAFVADFVTVLDGAMADPAGGRVREEEATVLRDAVNAAFGGAARLEPGSFPWRNVLLLAVDGAERTRCVAPHALGGLSVRDRGPEGPAAARIAEAMQRAEATLGPHEMNVVRVDLRENPVTGLWCWGGGRIGPMEPASERVGARIVVVSGRGYPRGLAEAAGCEVVDAGGHEASAADAALKALDGGADVAVVLLRGPEVASLAGDPGRKVEDLERIDASVVGPLLRGLAARGEHRIAVCADVAISSAERRALPDAVPFALAGVGVPPSRKAVAFHEESAKSSDLSIEDARDFLAYVMGR